MKCANCGSEQVANYCAQCGQNDREYQRSLPPMLWELLKETVEVDSRIARTLKLLLFVPGELTAEFSRNRRASYVSPFRLYLFINVLFFLLVSVTADLSGEIIPAAVVIESEQDVATADEEVLFQLIPEQRHPQLEAVLARPDSAWSKRLLLEVTREFVPTVSGSGESIEPASPLRRYLFTQFVTALADPSRFVRDLFDNLPVVLFVILPFYAGILNLMYRRPRRYYVENLVFVTHLHSFAFVIYAALLLLSGIGEADSLLYLLLAGYHFAALKRYYRNSYLRTACKFLVQVFLYFFILVPTSFFLVAVFTLAMV
jgi:hypothetical protein